MASDFYDAGPIGRLAINLFHGWGYNFYRAENQLREDDRMIRANACALLGEARASVDAAEAAYRRLEIAPPSRARPFPPPSVVADVQALERLSRAIGAAEAQIRVQPAPESDRMSELFRRERDVLMRLADCDGQLIGQAEMLRAKLADAEATAILAMRRDLEGGLEAIDDTLRLRRAILIAPA